MPRAGLSRAAVVELALAAVDDGGPRGFADLTLAGVAARAGVAVPSLYKHVDSLADLKREVAVASVRGLTAALTAAAIGRAGGDALRATATAYRAFATASPGRYSATQVAPHGSDGADRTLSEAMAETVTVVAAVVGGCGVPSERVVDAIRAVRSGLHGFVSLELGGGFGMPEDVEASFAFLVRTLEVGIRG